MAQETEGNAVKSPLDELIELGLVDRPESTVQTVQVQTNVPTGAPWTPPTVNTQAGFVPPKWYPLLQYALCSGAEKGAMLEGARGCGKSTAIRRLADDSGAKTVTMQCAANMQIDSLIGCWSVENGATKFIDGPLAIAVRNGSWLLCEEANVIHPGVWSAVNTLTDKTGEGLRLPTGEIIPPHADFRLILLFNEGVQYSGTRDVNAALKRRLVPIHCTYPDQAQEECILAGMTGVKWNNPAATAVHVPCPPPKMAADRIVKQTAQLGKMIRAAQGLNFDLSTDILARFVNVRMAGVCDWTEAFQRVICDMLGAPEVTVPQRTLLGNIWLQSGTWS